MSRESTWEKEERTRQENQIIWGILGHGEESELCSKRAWKPGNSFKQGQ